MTEILNAVSKVTDVTEEEIKSASRRRTASIARALFYSICLSRNINSCRVAEFIGKSRSTVEEMARRYDDYCTSSKKLYEDRKKVMELLGEEEEYIKSTWQTSGNETSIIFGNNRYRILDVSSKFFGDSFACFRNDEYLFSRKNHLFAMRSLMEAAMLERTT